MVSLPSFVPTFHHEPYAAIDPTKTDLHGKTVVISGGASGIGRATCTAFAQAGVSHLIILDRCQTSLLKLRDQLAETYGRTTQFHAFVANVTDSQLIDEIFGQVHTEIGPTDILVSNAGYTPTPGPLALAPESDWWQTFEINVRGSYNLTRCFLRHAAPGAILINLSSILAHWRVEEGYLDGVSAYGASKLAITRVMEIVQRENPSFRVVNVHPGLVATDMAAKAGTTEISTDDGKWFGRYCMLEDDRLI
jgi:NAD(P)-dependent dehydrogenase (short-subunit alcohol dehydrogenase family)